jgi:hypothetical protein
MATNAISGRKIQIARGNATLRRGWRLHGPFTSDDGVFNAAAGDGMSDDQVKLTGLDLTLGIPFSSIADRGMLAGPRPEVELEKQIAGKQRSAGAR